MLSVLLHVQSRVLKPPPLQEQKLRQLQLPPELEDLDEPPAMLREEA